MLLALWVKLFYFVALYHYAHSLKLATALLTEPKGRVYPQKISRLCFSTDASRHSLPDIISRPVVRLLDLSEHLIPYEEGLVMQQRLVDEHISMQSGSSSPCAGSLLFLQHFPVYTIGTGGTEESGPFSNVDENGVPLDFKVFPVGRGGQTTYHGPGQLVMYPILDLNYFEKDINSYLRGLEEVVIRTLKDFDIEAGRIEGLTGVWVGNKKLAAIGIHIKRWVTMHGAALNVNVDLRYFRNIIPCGISDKPVGSMHEFLTNVTITSARLRMMENFQSVFGCSFDTPDPECLSPKAS
eukprot:scaffold614_cov157-Ochromonas_danica.AAC.8